MNIYKCTHKYILYFSTYNIYIHWNIPTHTHTDKCMWVCQNTYTHFNSPTSLPPPTYNTSSKIHWQYVLCRHEITSQKFSKGRTSTQTSEGSRVEPKLIHYMCCICLLLKSPEHSGCLSLSLSDCKLPPDSSPRPHLSLLKTLSFCLFPLSSDDMPQLLTKSYILALACSTTV